MSATWRSFEPHRRIALRQRLHHERRNDIGVLAFGIGVESVNLVDCALRRLEGLRLDRVVDALCYAAWPAVLQILRVQTGWNAERIGVELALDAIDRRRAVCDLIEVARHDAGMTMVLRRVERAE